mgnify:CR=1 FL=1
MRRGAGETVDGMFFSKRLLDRVAARNDPKCPAGWHVTYAGRVNRDFREIEHFVPLATRVMDIGSGFAGIDVLLGRDSGVTWVHLIDGDGSGDRNAGFANTMLPWYDVRLGAQLVRDNVRHAKVTTVVVPPIPQPWSADMVISLKSWGHHYPVGVYLDLVKRSLRPGGYVILDIRTGSGGRHNLEAAGFVFMARVGGTIKTDRMVFRR